jgi:hypothetical protein
MRLVNLTPHEITIVQDLGDPVRVPPSGTVARCQEQRAVVAHLKVEGGVVPVTHTIFGEVQGLPEPEPSTWFVVSRVVQEACPNRKDLLIPDDSVRDQDGRIIGCRALRQLG